MGSKPAIAILVGPFSGPVHGVSVINAKLAERMAAQGLAVKRIDLSPGRRSRGLAYHLTRSGRAVSGFFRLLWGPLQSRHRVVMSVDGGIGLVYNIVLAAAVRLTGQALLLYHHSTRYILVESRLMRLLLAIAGRDVRHVFCSPKMAALFQARYAGPVEAMIVSNAAWIDLPSPGTGSTTGLRLGFLSALTLDKGLGRAIETLRQARQHGQAAELILAGATVDEAGRQVIRQAQAEFGDALIDRGVLHGAQKASFYGALDVFLFPSLYPHETQSLVVPEALAAGTPVIAYDHRFVGELVGEGGRLIPTTEPFAEKAAAWAAEGQGDALRRARRAAARGQFETEWRQAAGQVEQLIAWAAGKTA